MHKIENSVAVSLLPMHCKRGVILKQKSPEPAGALLIANVLDTASSTPGSRAEVRSRPDIDYNLDCQQDGLRQLQCRNN